MLYCCRVIMLKKELRLNKQSAYTATYRVKNSHHRGGITLFVGLKKKSDAPTRAGFVVSKKTHKRAVKRNRLRRLMRESYRLLQKENALGCSQEYMSLIFVGTEHALGKSFLEIQSTIDELLKRL